MKLFFIVFFISVTCLAQTTTTLPHHKPTIPPRVFVSPVCKMSVIGKSAQETKNIQALKAKFHCK